MTTRTMQLLSSDPSEDEPLEMAEENGTIRMALRLEATDADPEICSSGPPVENPNPIGQK